MVVLPQKWDLCGLWQIQECAYQFLQKYNTVCSFYVDEMRIELKVNLIKQAECKFCHMLSLVFIHAG